MRGACTACQRVGSCVAALKPKRCKLWVYTGSVQTLQYNLVGEIRRNTAAQGMKSTSRELMLTALALLNAFAADKHWLAALAEEGDVFDSLDPEDEQLIRALGRFAPGSIKLLTRDELLCERYPAQTITPQQYLQTPLEPKTIEFCDLGVQQDRIQIGRAHV